MEDFLPRLRMELMRNEQLWTADESRQTKIQVQRHTQSIPLRASERKPNDDRKTEDIQESRITRYATSFPVAMSFLSRAEMLLQGTLERALYVRLLPQAVVYPHVDTGAYYAVRDRYHFVVSSRQGSLLKSGGEEVTMQEGELWWFDNKALHESSNPSDEWRVHLIFDIF